MRRQHLRKADGGLSKRSRTLVTMEMNYWYSEVPNAKRTIYLENTDTWRNAKVPPSSGMA